MYSLGGEHILSAFRCIFIDPSRSFSFVMNLRFSMGAERIAVLEDSRRPRQLGLYKEQGKKIVRLMSLASQDEHLMHSSNQRSQEINFNGEHKLQHLNRWSISNSVAVFSDEGNWHIPRTRSLENAGRG